MKKIALLTVLIAVSLAVKSQSALHFGTGSRVVNTIIFQNPDATPVSTGVPVSFSASDQVLPVDNYNLPPLPVAPFGSDFRISRTSPVFDRGSQDAAMGTLDLDNMPRVSCRTVDIGAFEYQALPTQITVQPTHDGRLCEGSTLLLSVEASGEPGTISFQWQHNGVNIPGAQSSTLVIPDIALAHVGYYRVIVFGACCNDTSHVVRLDVDLRPMVVAMSDTTIFPNQSVTLYVTESIGTVVWFAYDMETVVLNTTITNITESTQFFAVATNGVCPDVAIAPVQIIVDGFLCVVQTHADATVCANDPFRLLIYEATVTARWSMIGGAADIPNGAIVRVPETSRFVLTGFDENGNVCGRDTLTLTVPVIALTVRGDESYCMGTEVFLHSVPPADYWFIGESAIGSGNLLLEPPMGVTTIFTAQRTDLATGCVVRRDVAIAVNPPDLTLPFAQVVSPGQYRLTVCEGDFVHLLTNIDPVLILWERMSDNADLPEDPTILGVNDVFRAHAWDQQCGDVYVELTLTVQPMPSFEILPHAPVCPGHPIFPTAIPGASQWFAGEDRVFFPIALYETQEFVGVLIDGYCEVRETITIAIEDCELVLDIASDDGCFSGDGSAYVTVQNFGIPPFTFAWSSGATTALVENLMPGEHTVIVTDAVNTTGTASVTIAPVTPLQLSYTVDVATAGNCGNANVHVTVYGGEPPYYFEWTSLSQEDFISHGQNLSNVYAGIYRLHIVDTRGCETEHYIMVRCEFERTMPSILVTPNNDGANDYLYIRDIEFFPINTVTIINSYGAEIITIQNFNNRDRVWDGRNSRNQFVPDGTYYYIVTAEGVPPMAGWIIVRLSPGN